MKLKSIIASTLTAGMLALPGTASSSLLVAGIGSVTGGLGIAALVCGWVGFLSLGVHKDKNGNPHLTGWAPTLASVIMLNNSSMGVEEQINQNLPEDLGVDAETLGMDQSKIEAYYENLPLLRQVAMEITSEIINGKKVFSTTEQVISFAEQRWDESGLDTSAIEVMKAYSRYQSLQEG